MVSWINSATSTLDGAIYGLTDENIAQAFIRAQDRGVTVRLIQDRSQASGSRTIRERLAREGITVRLRRGSRGGLQHNKFLVIDAKYVITGSFNWTRSASRHNDENFVVLDDGADRFQSQFDLLWRQPEARESRHHGKRYRFKAPSSRNH